MAPHDNIIVLDLRQMKNLHFHKIGPISTKEVGEIQNQYSSFTTVGPLLAYMDY